jgi:mannose-6-phosphate isomerase-like protein (cupin superfamily)
MNNFRIISMQEPIQDILIQLEQNSSMWSMVSQMQNIGGDKNPPGFLPLIMGAIQNPGDNIKDSELQANTRAYKLFPSVHAFWARYGLKNISRCAFFRLPPGGAVSTHIDDGAYYLTRDRYHLSIQGDYEYTVDGESRIIRPGTFFWFDNKKPHSAKNVSDVDRLTLVFDVPKQK